MLSSAVALSLVCGRASPETQARLIKLEELARIISPPEFWTPTLSTRLTVLFILIVNLDVEYFRKRLSDAHAETIILEMVKTMQEFFRAPSPPTATITFTRLRDLLLTGDETTGENNALYGWRFILTEKTVTLAHGLEGKTTYSSALPKVEAWSIFSVVEDLLIKINPQLDSQLNPLDESEKMRLDTLLQLCDVPSQIEHARRLVKEILPSMSWFLEKRFTFRILAHPSSNRISIATPFTDWHQEIEYPEITDDRRGNYFTTIDDKTVFYVRELFYPLSLMAFAATVAVLGLLLGLGIGKFKSYQQGSNILSYSAIVAGAVLSVGPKVIRRNWEYYDFVRCRRLIRSTSELRREFSVRNVANDGRPASEIKINKYLKDLYDQVSLSPGGISVQGKHSCIYLSSPTSNGFDCDVPNDRELVFSNAEKVVVSFTSDYIDVQLTRKIRSNMEGLIHRFKIPVMYSSTGTSPRSGLELYHVEPVTRFLSLADFGTPPLLDFVYIPTYKLGYKKGACSLKRAVKRLLTCDLRLDMFLGYLNYSPRDISNQSEDINIEDQ